MKIFCKNKLIIGGIYPIKDFKIDGYVEKTDIYNESIINFGESEASIYAIGYLSEVSYSVKGEKEVKYEYFENEKNIEYEFSDDSTKEEIEKFILDDLHNKVSILQKKLRLITGLGISIPIAISTLYKENSDFFSFVGSCFCEPVVLNVRDYDDNMKNQLINNLRFYIADKAIINLEKHNSRYKRALKFYNKSFESHDNGVRFILLFSALESLFNLGNEENITDEISKYSSKILFLSKKDAKSSKWKIITYYDIRSKYLHGNEGFEITNSMESNLRNYVREILLIYWNISLIYKINNADEIKQFLDSIDENTLDVRIQLFIKYLRTSPEKYSELYSKIRENFLNKDYSVLSNKTL